MDSDIHRSDGIFHENLENRREYPHKPYIAITRVHAEHFLLQWQYGSTFVVFMQLFFFEIHAKKV